MALRASGPSSPVASTRCIERSNGFPGATGPRLRAGSSTKPLKEFALIAALSRRFGRTGRSVLRGIGDDAAIVRPSPGYLLLLTTDLLAEGIHFDLATATFEDIGYKAAAANLSDIAAMGGTPQHLLVSLAIPTGYAASDILRLYRGVMTACRPHGVELIGGDTSASQRGLFISITLTGLVPPKEVLTRDGAKVGDLLYVTGTLGDSRAGLHLLTAKGQAQPYARHLIDRHLHPTPRITAGRLLASHGLATAAIDLSDGLSGDLAHLCTLSGVGAEIHSDTLPLSRACRAYAIASRTDPIRLALAGGEDYELLFTVPPRSRARLERLGARLGCAVSCIGTIRPKAFGLRLRNEKGSWRRLAITSYQHFQERPISL